MIGIRKKLNTISLSMALVAACKPVSPPEAPPARTPPPPQAANSSDSGYDRSQTSTPQQLQTSTATKNSTQPDAQNAPDPTSAALTKIPPNNDAMNAPQTPAASQNNGLFNFGNGSLFNSLFGLASSAFGGAFGSQGDANSFSGFDSGSFAANSPSSSPAFSSSPPPPAAPAPQNNAAGPSSGIPQGQNSSHASGSQIPAPLKANAAGNVRYKIANYGGALQANKRALANAADSAGATAEEKAVIIAIAMQETTLMDINQRDGSKDGTPSANISILNMNLDMIKNLGYSRNDGGAHLNSASALPEAVGYMIKAIRTWGIERTLNYHRGGRTAFNDGTSYGAYDYRNAITTIYNQIAADPTLESDGRRVEIDVYHV